ncbi:hypothetical protein GTQ43_29350 [Nostoc sp. KVJ3]|uniref:CTB family bacteriocin n=1 Tax=Nostoc sp. KVJ3 TaxID=457945 RepID=UPI002238287E|nr:CTB family bacteriocin [Nostoc sp. KVJ3]MCW5317736.1 hypothetical protein [Nostoc sp. KVJ3]
MSDNIKPVELSTEELDTVAGGLIDVTQLAAVETNFEAVNSSAFAGKGFAGTSGIAVNDESKSIAFRHDFVD